MLYMGCKKLSLRAIMLSATCFSVVTSHTPEIARRQATTPTPTSGASSNSVTAVSECHLHQTVQYCMAGATEYRVLSEATATTNLPAQYTGCHSHGSALWCLSPGGSEVEIAAEGDSHGTTTPSQTPAPAAISAAATQASSITAISDCHRHDTEVFCMVGTTEYQVLTTPTATSDLPPSYTDCHSHGTELFCVDSKGQDVEVALAGSEEAHSGGSSDESTSGSSSGGQNCHFHAGVEHCVGEGESEGGSSAANCERRDRDYNIPLRIGLLFVILVTSAIGVFAPILLTSLAPKKLDTVLLVLKQFGTGVIIATAFVHLYTHANLMFTNECLGELEYEATTSAIVMAGIFLSFVVEYLGHRLVYWQISKGAKKQGLSSAVAQRKDGVVSVLVMEAGIIFHSLLIGITLVVAGDSFFITLFIVILFHQMFEGIALGSRIASVGHSPPRFGHGKGYHVHPENIAPVNSKTGSGAESDRPNSPKEPERQHLGMWSKLGMGAAFALVTPVGMAIGIGVLHQFNGNDPSTLIAIGTLDALSAGILVWVGVVEMWAGDWMFGGELTHASAVTTVLAGIGLVSGMILMSVLGKWA